MSKFLSMFQKSGSSSKSSRPESYRETKKEKETKPPKEKKVKPPPQPKPPFKRINGFQHPLEIAQLSTWFFFGAIGILGVFDASVEFYDQPGFLTLILVLFFIFFAGTWYYGYQAHKVDPKSEVLPVTCPEIDRKNFRRCYSGCDGYVKCGSYHCRKCGKCSEGFDHHCLWLNNCIGSKNYFEFFMTLVYVDIYLTIWNAIGLYTFVRFWTNEAEANERWDFMGGQVPVSCLIGTFLVVTIVFAALVLQLMIFHGILIWRGTATVNFLKGETGESDEFGAKLLRLCSFAVNGMACKRKRKRAKVVQAPPEKSEIELCEEGSPQRQPPAKIDFDPPGQPKAKAAAAAPKQETSSTTDESK